MKLFWKIYLGVVIPAVVLCSLGVYIAATYELSNKVAHAIEINMLASRLIAGEVEKESVEHKWPFDSLRKLSERDDFLFWWIVADEGKIHLANDTSFIGTNAYTYFPQIEQITGSERLFLDKERHVGICVKLFGNGQKRSFWIGFSLKWLAVLQRRIIQLSALILLLAIGMHGVVVYFAVKHFTRPVKSLAEGATIIGMGKLSHRIEIQSKDELGYLSHSFNKMAERLEATTTSIDNLNREIAERKKAEQRQTRLLEQLEKTNRELNDFAYIASHDLKAPLRGIATLANWISTDYADKLDEQGRKQMGLLTNRVARMHNLIDGILQYSRIGRVKEEKVVVNLNELVSEAIDTIAPPENIAITVESELPTIECERTRIMQVFQNLISNAIKYMDKPQGHIEVGCAEDDGCWKFYVTDNGPGIEEKYFEKIFQIFQTLSHRDEVESTGIGLSLVKKIVEMYGGKVWVESQVGEGSTFFFTLPKQKIGVKDEEFEVSINRYST